MPEDVPAPAAAFYFDLASPQAYLVSERMLQALPAPAQWRPVLARELRGEGTSTYDGARSSKGATRPRGGAPGYADTPRERIEARASELGLQPLRWPRPFPFDSSLAMRAAAYAASIGRGVPFAQAAFRQAFAGGHSLEDPDFVLIAAAACEMHPQAVLRGVQLRSTVQLLADATAQARRAGVTDVPAIVVDGRVFAGERAPEDAAEHMRLTGARCASAPAGASPSAPAGVPPEAPPR